MGRVFICAACLEMTLRMNWFKGEVTASERPNSPGGSTLSRAFSEISRSPNVFAVLFIPSQPRSSLRSRFDRLQIVLLLLKRIRTLSTRRSSLSGEVSPAKRKTYWFICLCSQQANTARPWDTTHPAFDLFKRWAAVCQRCGNISHF